LVDHVKGIAAHRFDARIDEGILDARHGEGRGRQKIGALSQARELSRPDRRLATRTELSGLEPLLRGRKEALALGDILLSAAGDRIDVTHRSHCCS
jgi:hypothetical protein